VGEPRCDIAGGEAYVTLSLVPRCGRLEDDEQTCSRALGAVKLRTGGDGWSFAQKSATQPPPVAG
jgi:hypothetical protein